MTVQLIEKNGKPEFAVLPYKEYEKLIIMAETNEELKAYDKAKEKNEEAFPQEVVDLLLNGKNPVKIFRNFRNLSVKELAEKSSVSIRYIYKIEADERQGTVNVLKKISKALGLELEDIV